MYNLEFNLPLIFRHLCLPIYPEALGINYAIYSTVYQAPKKSKAIWTLEEDAMLIQRKNNGYL